MPRTPRGGIVAQGKVVKIDGPGLLKKLPTLGAKAEGVASALAEAAQSVVSETARESLAAWMKGEKITPEARKIPSPSLCGRVTGLYDGAGRAGFTVRAFAKGLKEDVFLGEGKTGLQGEYLLTYQRPGGRSLDVMVRVFGAGGAIIAESPVIFNARPSETLDLSVDTSEGRPSEYQILAGKVVPLLRGASPADLVENEIEFLAGRTYEPELHMAFFALAHRHSRDTNVRPEVFYGFFRQGLPTSLPALLLRPMESLKEALALSVQANVSPAGLEPEVDRLHAQGAERILAATKGSPRALLSTAGLNVEEQKTFVAAYARHAGTPEEFWKSLDGTPLASKAGDLKDVVQMGLLTGDNAPLIQSLRGKGVRSLRDVAVLGREELKKIVASSDSILSGFPSLEEGETDDRKADRVAGDVLELLNEAMPTVFLSARLSKSASSLETKSAARLLANAPELELRDDDIDGFLARGGDRLFQGVDDKKSAVALLKKFQRVMRVAPQAEHMELLLADGLGSAREVAGLSELSFLQKFGPVMGDARAISYHQKARETTSALAMVATGVLQAVNDAPVAAVGPSAAFLKTMPTLASLFGSFGWCECKDCRSVYSPAAYLVDLLQFINPKAGVKPLNRLRLRRPDLEHIPLTCDNTNIVLPYVDLVNEILEFFVANGELTPGAARDTFGVTSAELGVTPQHALKTAYHVLKNAASSPVLPFDKALEASRLYLSHLGTSWHEVMSVFRKNGVPSAEEICLESLGISPAERAILVGEDPRPLREFYGYGSGQAIFVNEEGSIAHEPWEENLRRVPEFLRRTGTTFEELSFLINTRSLNFEEPRMFLKEKGNVPTGDLAKTEISNLTLERMDKIHRFLRLARKTGWSIPDTGEALRSLQGTEINDDLLKKISAAKKLGEELKLTPPVLFSLWASIPTRGQNSLYSQLFENKAVRNPVDPDFALTEGGLFPNSGKTLEEKSSLLLSAFRLNDEDLSLIRDASGLSGEDVPLSLENLSVLHRHVVLARALKLKAKDFVSLLVFLGIDPFQAGSPEPTTNFVTRVKNILAAGFGISPLAYLFLSEGSSLVGESQADALDAVSAVRDGLKKIVDETATVPDPTGDLLQARLALVLAPDLLEDALAVIDGSGGPPDAAGFIEAHFAPWTDVEEAKGVLLNPTPADPEERKNKNRAYVLARLLDRARRFMSRDLVLQVLGDKCGLEISAVDALLSAGLRSTVDSTQWALFDFLALSDSSASTTPAQRTFLRLHKAVLVAKGFDLTGREIEFLARRPEKMEGLDLNKFPLDPGPLDPSLFASWERALSLFQLRARWPQGEASLVDLLAAGTLEEALAAFSRAAGWDPGLIAWCAGAEGFALSLSDLQSAAGLLRLEAALSVARRTGLSPASLMGMASGEPTFERADVLFSAVKAKYDAAEWSAAAKPLSDALREKSKTALVAFLLNQDAIAEKRITSADRLFEYFLIDVEMTACLKTSRIKQAISSVQLFIQRCLMNLENGVSPSAIDADQWEWMKNYRLWEANRKVFLYPENWIEPELRDDKTPFFRELESQLLQNDVSADTAEAAFLSYLEKLDGVARLEVCGFYTESEPGEPLVTHVVARTPDIPHSHYYRRRVDGRGWTPWEKIEMDLEGDHVLPRVHNNRLYLFWVTFEEKPDTEKTLEGPFLQSQEHWQWIQDHRAWREEHDIWQALKDAREAWDSMLQVVQQMVDPFLNDEQMQAFVDSFSEGAPPEPGDEPREPTEPQRGVDPVMTRWEIKLHWTENKNGKWSPKRTAHETIKSHFIWRTLEDWQEEQGGASLGDLGTKDTVVAVALPSPAEHYFRTDLVGGRLRVTAYRRYSKSFPVLNAGNVTARSHHSIGYFQFHDGAKVRSVQVYGPLAYGSLEKPNKSTNEFQQFIDVSGRALKFVRDNGSLNPVLGSIPVPAGNYALTVEHQFKDFNMEPPFHRFFYQDKLRSYMAFYKPDQPLSSFREGLKAAPALSFDLDEGLVSRYRTRALTSPSEKRGMFTGRGLGVAALRSAGNSSLTLAESALAAPKVAVDLSSRKTAPVIVGRRTLPDNIALLKPFIKFETFFHPHAGNFLSILYQKGVSGLLSRRTQTLDNDAGPQGNVFREEYRPSPLVHGVWPRENVDFGAGSYSAYNWELFFHVPMLIALALGKNQRFEEASAWFHHVFNPMTASNDPVPGRYWNTLPFFKNTNPEDDQISHLLTVLSSARPADAALREDVEEQIQRWREDPFNPHLIARLRITAYQKNVVMKYIDNLIQRGDQLFSLDTMESINEATMIYLLAHELMGRRPVEVPSPLAVKPKSYFQLKGEGLDDFSNALVEFENTFPYRPPSFPTLTLYSQKKLMGKSGKASFAPVKPKHGAVPVVATAPETFYFCIPKNDQLLKMWDTIEDRMFKIRNCLNIEGVARELPLFEPPIDPAMLMKAQAAGMSVASVMSDVNGPLPRHRFAVMIQKALELCAEVKSLGAGLLSALEKKDAEVLSRLRAGHETSLLEAIRDAKRLQVKEAEENILGLEKSKALAEIRRNYYREIERISGYEQENMDSLDAAHVFSQIAQGVAAGASGAHIMPNFEIGTNGWAATPKVTAMFGGDNLGSALEAISKNIAMISAQHSHEATMASIRGGYDRRWKEWKFQEKLAEREMGQIDKQILGAEIRKTIAEKELENHDQQIENAASVELFLREKFSNADLFGWMQGEISRVFFQAYKLAYEMAKRAEKSFRYELGVADSHFIQYGYWEDLRKGLLSGEKLFVDLKRMETAYMDQNKREYEIAKQVSLVQLDPAALIRLKETGDCEVELPEALFDMDYPGHYMRRIKSVALTLPCVAGPHSGVHCTLTLLRAKTRRDPSAQGDYLESTETEDPRFDTRFGGPTSVATSHGRNDAGLFEVNFRDERYLPFEGAGAVSRWRLSLPKATNSFDLGTLSDVIVHVHYTARDGGELLRRKASASVTLSTPKEGLTRFFSARHEFPDAWHRFLHAPTELGGHSLALDISSQRFPFLFRGKAIALDACEVVLKLKPGIAYQNGQNMTVDFLREGGASFSGKGLLPGALFNLPGVKLFGDQAGESLGGWTLSVPANAIGPLHPALKKQVMVNSVPQERLNPAAFEDLWFLVRYRVSDQ